MIIELALPYPPSANRLWRSYGKNVCKSKEYTSWLVAAGLMARSQRPAAIVGPYKILINASRPDKRRRDIDNLIKPIGDLLQSIGVVRDDCDCEMVSARWVTTGEGVNVRLETAGAE